MYIYIYMFTYIHIHVHIHWRLRHLPPAIYQYMFRWFDVMIAVLAWLMARCFACAFCFACWACLACCACCDYLLCLHCSRCWVCLLAGFAGLLTCWPSFQLSLLVLLEAADFILGGPEVYCNEYYSNLIIWSQWLRLKQTLIPQSHRDDGRQM